MGDRLIAAGQDVRSVKDALGKLNVSDPAVFGDHAGDAVKTFWSAWQDELGVNLDALIDLGGKVHTTASNYATTDHGVEKQYQKPGA
ncbi:hypothetical protein ABT247_28110 [Kitasatospora sp. NPDC001539]|uniref:hypothetical protein n=1 Tax=unclassified Kitasatospora TaxID=2633591 RepID=UPI0033318719